MNTIEKISRKIARMIDDEIRDLGHEPEVFYRSHNLSKKIWRIRAAKSFTCSGIEEIVSLAEKDIDYEHRTAV